MKNGENSNKSRLTVILISLIAISIVVTSCDVRCAEPFSPDDGILDTNIDITIHARNIPTNASEKPVGEGLNIKPSVYSVKAYPPSLDRGQSTKITVVAEDADLDTLYYSYLHLEGSGRLWFEDGTTNMSQSLNNEIMFTADTNAFGTNIFVIDVSDLKEEGRRTVELTVIVGRWETIGTRGIVPGTTRQFDMALSNGATTAEPWIVFHSDDSSFLAGGDTTVVSAKRWNASTTNWLDVGRKGFGRYQPNPFTTPNTLTIRTNLNAKQVEEIDLRFVDPNKDGVGNMMVKYIDHLFLGGIAVRIFTNTAVTGTADDYCWMYLSGPAGGYENQVLGVAGEGEGAFTSVSYDNRGLPAFAWLSTWEPSWEYIMSWIAQITPFQHVKAAINAGDDRLSWERLYEDEVNLGFLVPPNYEHGYPCVLVDSKNQVYVAYGDEKHSQQPITPMIMVHNDNGPHYWPMTVLTRKGSKWEPLGGASISEMITEDGVMETVGAVDSSDNLYFAFRDMGNDGKLSVIRWDGISWEPIGGWGISDSTAHYISLCIDHNDDLYVAYSDGGQNYKATAMKYNPGLDAWGVLGRKGMSDSVVQFTSIDVARNGDVYIGYVDWHEDLNGSPVVKKYIPPSE